jgi:excinuclease ABC subunit C
MIPASIQIRDGALPETPGVYLMKDAAGTVLYVGKATSLKRRVQQHFLRPHNRLIEEMLQKVQEIDYIQKPSALEALILEANLIKYYYPYYNTLEKDNKSFLYPVFTREPFPKPLLVRGKDLSVDPNAYLGVYGPYTSARSLRASLDWLRRIFPWSTCEPGQKKACFSTHIGLCPGVCIGTADQRAYRRTIRDLMAFFDGEKEGILKRLRKDMAEAARDERFELAAKIRNQLFALEHIKDIAMLKREDDEVDMIHKSDAPIAFLGRIEGYDISHVQGTAIVASMVVFEGGQPAKGEYRRFRMKTVEGSNDVASMREALMRRFRHEWPKPDVLLIDGGLAQVHAVEQVLHELSIHIPVIGMVKGPDRKRTDLVCSQKHEAVCRMGEDYLRLLTQVRDEAHRFAIQYHRTVRSALFLGGPRART